jgi:tight adherence protein C
MMTMMVVLASAAASDGSMTLGLILFGCAIGIIAFVVINNLDEKQTVRNSIRQLEEYGQTGAIETERDRELLRPAYERALAPVLGGMVNFGRRLFPTDYVARTKKKHQSAGRYDPAAVDRFLAFRVACLVIIPIAFFVFLVFNSFGLSMKMNVICFLLLTAAAILLPEARLDSAVEDRQREIQRSLPDILDLLVISVEAGLGFEQALDRTVASVPGALSLEFARMLGETRAGAARADAMRAMEERVNVPEVRSFVLAIIQADTFGVSIGRVLRGQAEEMRIKRRQLAQERAQKAPVKMLIPMVFCIFPSLFVVVIGPAIISIRKAFSK